jgi:hypothetical protein
LKNALLIAIMMIASLAEAQTTVTGAGPSSASQVINLFSACSGIKYLGADGACHSASGASAGTTLDIQFAGAGNTFDADTGQITADKTNHRICVHWSGGFCDGYSYKAGANAMSLTGAFGNGKVWSDSVNHRMFADEGTWNVSAGKGIASFAAQAIVQGSAGADHLASFEAIPIFNISTNPIANVYGFYDLMTVNAGATVTQHRGVDIEAVAGSGTLGTNEAIYIAADTKGSSVWTLVSDRAAPSYWVGQSCFGAVCLPSEDVTASHGVKAAYYVATNMIFSATAPTIAGAGCGGSSASIPNNNGTLAFTINVGTAPTSGGCTVTLPTAATGWYCDATDFTTNSTGIFQLKQTGGSTTSAVIQNFSDVAVATAPTANDIWRVSCKAY